MGRHLYNKDAEVVYWCEGPWDGMALFDTMKHAKEMDEGLTVTYNEDVSLLAKQSVLVFPAAKVFANAWASLCKDKYVILMAQNDHNRETEDGRPIPSASYRGMERIANKIAEQLGPDDLDIAILRWGQSDAQMYDEDLKHGYDVRDYLNA